MNQRLAGGPCQERPDDVGIGDVKQLSALPRESSDVLPESLIRLLTATPEVPGISGARVGALEVPHEDVLQVGLAPDLSGREVLQPGSSRVGKVEGEVTDHEVIIVHSAGLADESVVLEPETWIRCPGIFGDI